MQVKCIQALMSKLQLRRQKDDLIAGASAQRTTSTRQLYYAEAKALIQYLKGQDPQEQAGDKMRKKIIGMAHEMRWQHPDGSADMQRLDAWMRTSSYLHKPLRHYRYAELPTLVSQFEKVYISFLKGI